VVLFGESAFRQRHEQLPRFDGDKDRSKSL
jgi:hypothetical protein